MNGLVSSLPQFYMHVNFPILVGSIFMSLNFHSYLTRPQWCSPHNSSGLQRVSIDVGSFLGCQGKWGLLDPFYRGKWAHSGEGLTCLTQHTGDAAKSEEVGCGVSQGLLGEPESYLPDFRNSRLTLRGVMSTPSSPRHPPFTPPPSSTISLPPRPATLAKNSPGQDLFHPCCSLALGNGMSGRKINTAQAPK